MVEATPSVPDREGGSGRALRGLARDLGAAGLTAVLSLLFLFQPFKVEGNSMLPSLHTDERILVNKFVYHVLDIERGDVIVFRYPVDPNKSFVKRVIGIPGDIVEGRRGEVWVNGRLLDEQYLVRDFLGVEEFGPARVPPGSYFVLGDHRLVSNDSRDWGVVDRSFISGKAVVRYWPPSHLGRLDTPSQPCYGETP